MTDKVTATNTIEMGLITQTLKIEYELEDQVDYTVLEIMQMIVDSIGVGEA
jgi:hypothetical protein